MDVDVGDLISSLSASIVQDYTRFWVQMNSSTLRRVSSAPAVSTHTDTHTHPSRSPPTRWGSLDPHMQEAAAAGGAPARKTEMGGWVGGWMKAVDADMFSLFSGLFLFTSPLHQSVGIISLVKLSLEIVFPPRPFSQPVVCF